MVKSIEAIFDRINGVLDSESSGDFRIKLDKKAGIIRIYGSSCTSTTLALSSITEALEIAYTAAEHHPYWAMLYHSAEICKSVLDSWDNELSQDQVEEISWRSDEIKGAADRLLHN